jgi:hypothetical protein
MGPVAWVLVILAVGIVLAFPLAILVTIVLGAPLVGLDRLLRRCPRCGRRGGMTLVNFIRATVVIDGRRAPDHWSYYRCRRCGARLKHHHDQWGDVPDAELHYFGESREEATGGRERAFDSQKA